MQMGLLMEAVPAGEYVNAVKAVPVVLVLLVWARLLTWADKDSTPAHLPRVPLNMAMMGGLIAAFVLFFLLPGFWIALAALLVLLIAEMAAYLVLRQQKVGLGDLTAQFNDWLASWKPSGKKVVTAGPGQVLVASRSGDPLPAPAAEAPERVAYDAVQALLTVPMSKGAQRIEMTPVEGVYAVRYYVDGVVYHGDTLDRGRAAAGIGLIKELAGLETNEKRKPQTGAMKATFGTVRQDMKIETAGSNAGEDLHITMDPKKVHALRLADLGFSDSQRELLKQTIIDGQGIVLVAAPKGQGLTSMLYGLIREHDAFLTHLQTIERDPDTDLEGITQNRLPANVAAGEEVKLAEWVSSQQPDAILVSSIEDPAAAKPLIAYAATGKRVYIGLRAANTFDALAHWRRLVGDDKLAMKQLKMILSGRILRRLCNACKTGYRPDPETLRKLNMDPDRISQLFQARTSPVRDPKGNPIPCDFCKDLHFRGRFGVFEVFQIDDDARQVVTSGGSMNQLKAVFRKQRGKYLQEQALAMVEQGQTSIQEVLRVLKGPEPSGGAAGGGAGGTPVRRPAGPAAPGVRARPAAS